jgi:predicted nucleic acid-binding protein
MTKVLLDTNVIVDFVLKREPFYENARTVFSEITKGNVQGYITAAMATDIFYLMQKINGKTWALDTLMDLTTILDVLTVYKKDVYAALKSKWNDFEDALQAQVATSNYMDAIITRNIKDYKKAQNLNIVLPSDFIQYIKR